MALRQVKKSGCSNMDELRYLDLVKSVMNQGHFKVDRTQVGTRSVFGASLQFDLSNNQVPLLTTKKMFWRGIVEELAWMCRGSTDATELSKKRIKIWDGNSSREFLDSRGLSHYAVGDIGPSYGFQWRKFGGNYATKQGGVDQLSEMVRLLKNDPLSRRILMTSWNPLQLDQMALPPCHVLVQFLTTTDQKMTCIVYQRSADLGLGVPFNIAFYGLLSHILADKANKKADRLILNMGDAHVYVNHRRGLELQLLREPRPWPTVSLKDIDKWDFTPDQVTLKNYDPWPAIALDMAV